MVMGEGKCPTSCKRGEVVKGNCPGGLIPGEMSGSRCKLEYNRHCAHAQYMRNNTKFTFGARSVDDS